MISIIISSYKPQYFSALEKNIAETCGVPYEIIKIDNPGLMGICEAYNKGAEKSKYDFLLFLHEDVKFHTQNWGQILTEKYFSLPNVGVLGFAGVKRRFNMCYGYGFSNIFFDEAFLFLDHNSYSNSNKKKVVNPIEVKVIDGVFMGMNRKVWKDVKFDESLPGFHFYDIDFTLRAAEKYKNYLINDIGFVHYSEGKFDNNWLQAAIKFNRRNYKNLDIPTSTERKKIRKDWYGRLKKEDISFFNRLRYCVALGFDRYSRSAMQDFLFYKKK